MDSFCDLGDRFLARVARTCTYQDAWDLNQRRQAHNISLLKRVEHKTSEADIDSEEHDAITRDDLAGQSDRPQESLNAEGGDNQSNSIADNERTGAPSTRLNVFHKFITLPNELRGRVLYFAVKHAAQSDLRSDRILTGSPNDYALPPPTSIDLFRGYTELAPLFNLRAVSKSVRKEVEEILYRENTIVFDMDRDLHFVFDPDLYHPWISHQAEKSLKDVREIYIVASCDVSHLTGLDQHDELLGAIIKDENLQGALKYTDDIRSKLPGLQRITIRINFFYPLDIDMMTDVSVLRTPFVDIFRGTDLRGHL